MHNLLKLLMVLSLVVGQGSSVAAAICRHQSAADHAIARASRDAGIAATAQTEESAASVNAKKGAPASSSAGAGPSDMLLPAGLATPFRTVERIRLRVRDGPPLAGASLRPLLEPPLA